MKTWHWIALGLLTLITLVLEFTVLADYDSHWWDSIPAFYIMWGFISCVLIIYVSKWFGKIFLFRDESYYDN
jgi:low affinity Fe/Cu permease